MKQNVVVNSSNDVQNQTVFVTVLKHQKINTGSFHSLKAAEKLN